MAEKSDKVDNFWSDKQSDKVDNFWSDKLCFEREIYPTQEEISSELDRLVSGLRVYPVNER